MDINTKDFWLKVKKEYKPEYPLSGICYTSCTFRKIWDIYYSDIVEKGKEFLKNKNENVFFIGFVFLFTSSSYDTPFNEKVKIRKQFIDYMINKFQ